MKAVSEAEFQRQVCQLASLYGFRWYHTHDSRRSPAGFPDLVLVHPARGVVYAELKSEKGVIRPEQAEWHELLTKAGQRVYVWRPHQLQEIANILGA